LISWSRNSI